MDQALIPIFTIQKFPAQNNWQIIAFSITIFFFNYSTCLYQFMNCDMYVIH